MAPSTLGNFTNLGIFTGKSLESGDIVNFPEIVIPILWRDWDEHPPYAHGDGQLWDRYIWEGEVADLEAYEDLDRSQRRAVFVPGVGCTVNSMMDLKNIQSTQGSRYEALVERGHYAAGAFTPYHGSTTKAIRSIPPGSELFAGYGESWIPWIPGAAVTQNEYLDAADEFTREFVHWLQQLRQKYSNEELSRPLIERLWKLSIKFPHPSREFTVLPEELDWEKLLNDGNLVVESRDYWRQKGVKSLEWLEKHGKCQDHLRPGVSTIPYAGRGAFANRNLPKGTVVGYAPLVHVGERAMDLWKIKYNHTAPNYYSKTDIVVNYSFGHKDSSILLTPYGAMVNYINHHKAKANVRIQWPNQEMVAHNPAWLTKDVAYLRDTTEKIGLSVDYVALRDIEEGEEIFMDYGDEWQRAWDEHIQNWQTPVDATAYVHLSNYDIDQLKTPTERASDPYPTNLHTLCTPSYAKQQNGDDYVFVHVLRSNTNHVYCEVQDRTSDKHGKSHHYTVKMQLEGDEIITVHQVTWPQGIDLYDKAFSQDWHLPQAFRHKLYIPDDMFPESWKILKRKSEPSTPQHQSSMPSSPSRPSSVPSSITRPSGASRMDP